MADPIVVSQSALSDMGNALSSLAAAMLADFGALQRGLQGADDQMRLAWAGGEMEVFEMIAGQRTQFLGDAMQAMNQMLIDAAAQYSGTDDAVAAAFTPYTP